MKISPVKLISFKSSENNIIGYDDAISKSRRDFIRCGIEQNQMPYQSIYEKEPRLEEYELKKLINFFLNKPKPVDGEIMSELPLSNLHRISDSQRYAPNIYRGSTLYDASEWVFDKIKAAGIKTIINLADYGNSYKEKVEKAGLEYLDFDIYHYIKSDWIDETVQKNKLVEFIKTMQKEYVYLGCEFGTYKTDAAIFLNTLFNPKVKGYCKIYSPKMVDYIPQAADQIYLNLTQKDKKSIGWTPEFEKAFTEKIAKLLHF